MQRIPRMSRDPIGSNNANKLEQKKFSLHHQFDYKSYNISIKGIPIHFRNPQYCHLTLKAVPDFYFGTLTSNQRLHSSDPL